MSLHASMSLPAQQAVIRRTQTTNPLPVRVRLTIYLRAAENKMARGLELATGDMWTRAYELAKEYREQLAILDAIESGAIKPI